MIQFMRKLARGAQIDIQFFNNVDRQADGTGLVHDRPFNRLPDPPGCVSRETETAFWVKLFHCPDQTEVTLFNQIQQRQAAIAVAAGDFHHQPQVTFNHSAAGRHVTAQCTPRKINFFLCGQQRRITDFAKIELRRIQYALGHAL
ncbi:Uncharacterised protein [Serratia proteamaculans]|nr:Uncharacterised protein [Serratia proteamaculans]